MSDLLEQVKADNPDLADLLTSGPISEMVTQWLGFVMGLPKPAREKLLEAFQQQLAEIGQEAPQ
jgi:hypothetical protein